MHAAMHTQLWHYASSLNNISHGVYDQGGQHQVLANTAMIAAFRIGYKRGKVDKLQP